MKSLAALIFLTPALAHAVEPWADPRLPVKGGLARSLDAGAEIAAARADGAKFERHEVLAGVWHDGSGLPRHARQENAPARPKIGTAYPAQMFAFDGQGQHFAVDTEGWKWREATVIAFAIAAGNRYFTSNYAGLPPQPVIAWSASPREFHVSFDQPLSTAAFAAMQGKVRVVQSRCTQAGERFETMRPGYQVDGKLNAGQLRDLMAYLLIPRKDAAR